MPPNNTQSIHIGDRVLIVRSPAVGAPRHTPCLGEVGVVRRLVEPGALGMTHAVFFAHLGPADGMTINYREDELALSEVQHTPLPRRSR